MYEAVENLSFINEWLKRDPKNFPLPMARTLVALYKWPDENIRKSAATTLCELAIKNTELAVLVGGISILCEAVIDPSLESSSELFMSRMIYLLNEPKTRNIIIGQFQIYNIFSHFTDIDREGGNNRVRGGGDMLYQEEARLKLACRAVITLFKNWSGIIYLGHEKRSLTSLIEALRQPIKPNVRQHIFDLLTEIINMGVNLCPKESENTPYNLRRYLAQTAYTQTKLLLNVGTYDVLLELSSIDDIEISSQALSLLRNFTYMMYHLVPFEQVKKPDFLMNSISLNNSRYDYIKSKCSSIYENMSNKITYKDDSLNIKNEFLYQCEYFYLNMTTNFPDHRFNKEIFEKIKEQDEGNLDLSTLKELAKNCGIYQKSEYQLWNF